MATFNHGNNLEMAKKLLAGNPLNGEAQVLDSVELQKNENKELALAIVDMRSVVGELRRDLARGTYQHQNELEGHLVSSLR